MKIKNKKGFTLTELLASIIILAVIMLIAVGSFNGIKNDTLKKQFENTKLSILNDAVSYAADMNINDVIYVSVDDLVSFGYIEPDDENGVVLKPDDQSKKINCYVIRVIYKNGGYDAEFSKTEDVSKEGTCAGFGVDDSNTNIKISSKNAPVGGWYTSDVTLSVEINGKDEQYLNNSTIEWTSLTGAYETGNNILLDIENALSTTYYVTVTNGEKVYKAKSVVKVDKKGPVVLSKNISLNYDNTEQTLKINATDYGGSGITEYAFVKSNDKSICDTASYKESSIFDMNEKGNYYICIKDKVGNISATETRIGEVLLDTNNTSVNPKPSSIKVLYDLDDSNIKLPEPERNGYMFVDWVDTNGDEINGITNGAIYVAKWKFIDVPISVIKTERFGNQTVKAKVNIILVLDHSGSMSGTMSNLKTVANSFVSSVDFEKGSTVSVIPFESSASILIDAGTKKDTIIEKINTLSDTGGTSFSDALSMTLTLLNSHLEFEKKETYVIFLSDGHGGGDGGYASQIRDKVNKLYTIGIGSGVDTETLTSIASTNCGDTPEESVVCYYSGSTNLDDMKNIFEKIKENIMTGYSEKTNEGVLSLDGELYVDPDEPVTISIRNTEIKITDLADAKALLDSNGDFDLAKIDSKYKLNGNLDGIVIEYYFVKPQK